MTIKCPICSDWFPLNDRMVEHLERMHGVKPSAKIKELER